MFPKTAVVMLKKKLVIKRSVVIFGGYSSLISENSEMYSFLFLSYHYL